MVTQSPPFTFDRGLLRQVADEKAKAYRAASPFPNTYIDGLFPSEVIELAASEFPSGDATGWTLLVHKNSRKLATADETLMGETCRQLIAQLNSGPVIEFLERMTGIEGLIPDPHLFGGGLHQIERGGFLRVHADFNHHQKLNLERRINLLLYLNPGWNEGWGGALELWNADMSAAAVRIPCLGGRLAVFNTTSTSYHGHPDPLDCPEGVARRSIAMYYYTRDRPVDEPKVGHSTLYQQPGRTPGSIEKQAASSWGRKARLRRWIPPAIYEALSSRISALR